MTVSARKPLGGWWSGRAGLVFPAIAAAFATYLLLGQLVMPVPADADPPGPRFFPWIVIGTLYLFALLLAIGIIRRPQPAVADVEIATEGKVHPTADEGTGWFSDWPRLAWAVGGFAAFIALLPILGWVLSGALLFWCMAKSLGTPHPRRDVLVALAFSSALYLVFAGILSVNLPAGAIFGGRI